MTFGTNVDTTIEHIIKLKKELKVYQLEEKVVKQRIKTAQATIEYQKVSNKSIKRKVSSNNKKKGKIWNPYTNRYRIYTVDAKKSIINQGIKWNNKYNPDSISDMFEKMEV